MLRPRRSWRWMYTRIAREYVESRSQGNTSSPRLVREQARQVRGKAAPACCQARCEKGGGGGAISGADPARDAASVDSPHLPSITATPCGFHVNPQGVFYM